MSKVKYDIKSIDPINQEIVGVREGSEELTTLELNREGKPLADGDEVVQTSIDDSGQLYVETLYRHKGPSRAATPAYRKGYDAIFGNKRDTSVN